MRYLSLRGGGQVTSIAEVSRFEPGLYVAARSVSAVIGAITIVPLYKAATVFWQGKELTSRPLRVQRSSEPVEVRFVAPGYRDQLLEVVPDREKTITVRLKRMRE